MTKLVKDRDAVARRELAALWRAALGEPPCLDAAPALVARFLVKALPPAAPYRPHKAPGGGPEGRRGPAPSRGADL